MPDLTCQIMHHMTCAPRRCDAAKPQAPWCIFWQIEVRHGRLNKHQAHAALPSDRVALVAHLHHTALALLLQDVAAYPGCQMTAKVNAHPEMKTHLSCTWG